MFKAHTLILQKLVGTFEHNRAVKMNTRSESVWLLEVLGGGEVTLYTETLAKLSEFYKL